MNSFQYQNLFELDSRTHFIVLRLQVSQFTSLSLVTHSSESMQSLIRTDSCNFSLIWIHVITYSSGFMQLLTHLNSCNHSFIRIHATSHSSEFMQSFIHPNSCNHSFIWIHVITYSSEFMQSLTHLNPCNHSSHSRWFFSESTLHSIWSLMFLTTFDRTLLTVRTSLRRKFESWNSW